jgi:hypothetical protein
MIDKQSRMLFHGDFKVEGFDRSTKLTTLKPRFIEYVKEMDKFYRKRLIVQLCWYHPRTLAVVL